MSMLPRFGLLLTFMVLAIHGAESEGCTAGGKTYKVGEHINYNPGYCISKTCMQDGSFAAVACPLIAIPRKWVFLPEDTSKAYPACCSVGVPPLRIVPDLLANLQYSGTLAITYTGGVKVDLGNVLTPTQVKSEPTVTYEADRDSYYLLCMTDPDAPSHQVPSWREFNHWLVGNIPGSDVSKGEVLTEYVGSGPPKGTGLHRYVFLLYKQPAKLTFDEPRVNKTTAEPRKYFSIQKLAKKYKMGDPAYINVFQARYDNYVPVVLQQLGIRVFP